MRAVSCASCTAPGGSPSRGALALVCSLVATGCHSRFKKRVGSIDDVRPDMVVPGGPYVALGGVGGDGLLAAAVNVAQGVRSIDLTRRVSSAVDPGPVSDAFLTEMDLALGEGPPFDLDRRSDAVRQIRMDGYGIEVAALGMPGVLTYNLSTWIYLPDGERVYTAGHHRAVSFGDPEAVSVVRGAVNNSRANKDMSDPEIQDMFEGGARWRAQQTGLRIRGHGG